MRKIMKDALAAVILAGIIPSMLFKLAGKTGGPAPDKDEIETEPPHAATYATTDAISDNTDVISVLMPDNTVHILELDTYVTSVVLREMPATFETEALKAQAVVARTYAMRQKTNGSKHELGAICTDPSCCQGYCSEEEYLSAGGTIENIQKIKNAVIGTKGEVLIYNGKLIEATYFSCSGGKTEAAVSVWGSDIPYLQSVMSPGEEHATHYTDTVTFSADKFAEKLDLLATGALDVRIGDIVYTEGGGVKTIDVSGRSFTGTEVRQRLNLRSTSFVITAVGSTITITTKGFGHRVGMSQYGADAMAVLGHDYHQILSHYYQGTELQQYEEAD